MRKSLIGLALLLVISASQAATVTLNGSSIKYQYDTVTNADALLLFGTPTIVGDTVRFLPPSFRAESVDGLASSPDLTGGTDIVSANFIFERVWSTNGDAFTQLQVVEFGDYEITNGDSVSGDLYVQAASNVNGLDFIFGTDEFNASGDSGGLGTWDMGVSLFPADDFTGDANDMAVSIQNTLTATTDANGETAWIQKKIAFTAGDAPITLVPLPAGVWLFGSALGLLGWSRRKRTV
ncbi:MAG: hypothetical protein OEU86_08150 [Gammaproteobacteria bacterium]|nr:hypothetical protein [Gammaproteobacteria bacterium]